VEHVCIICIHQKIIKVGPILVFVNHIKNLQMKMIVVAKDMNRMIQMNANEELINGKSAPDWLLEPRPDSFFKLAGTHSLEECKSLFMDIPDYYKLTAYTIIQLTAKTNKDVNMNNCRVFRQLLYSVYIDLKAKKEKDIHLPYYWFSDGVMIEPEWIVRITNGIIGWRCDDSRKECNMSDECIFWDGKI